MDVQSQAVIALASRLGDSQRRSMSPTKWNRFVLNLKDAEIDVDTIFQPGFNAASVPGVDDDLADQIAELLESAAAATMAATELGRYGIRIVTILDENYPEPFHAKLGALAPPLLSTALGTNPYSQVSGSELSGRETSLPTERTLPRLLQPRPPATDERSYRVGRGASTALQ